MRKGEEKEGGTCTDCPHCAGLGVVLGYCSLMHPKADQIIVPLFRALWNVSERLRSVINSRLARLEFLFKTIVWSWVFSNSFQIPAQVLNKITGTPKENLEWEFWGCSLITAMLFPSQSFHIQCCFAAIFHQYMKNLSVTRRTGLFDKCRPHLCFTAGMKPSLCETSDEGCSKQLFAARRLGVLLLFFLGRFSFETTGHFFPCSMGCCGARFHPECCLFWQLYFSKEKRERRVDFITVR